MHNCSQSLVYGGPKDVRERGEPRLTQALVWFRVDSNTITKMENSGEEEADMGRDLVQDTCSYKGQKPGSN